MFVTQHTRVEEPTAQRRNSGCLKCYIPLQPSGGTHGMSVEEDGAPWLVGRGCPPTWGRLTMGEMTLQLNFEGSPDLSFPSPLQHPIGMWFGVKKTDFGIG